MLAMIVIVAVIEVFRTIGTRILVTGAVEVVVVGHILSVTRACIVVEGIRLMLAIVNGGVVMLWLEGTRCVTEKSFDMMESM
jgi:hypothetical protein